MATPPPPPSSSTTLASMGWRRRRSGRRAGPASTSASERRPLATDCSRRAGRRGSVSTPSAAGSPVDRRRSCPPDENQKQKKTWLMVDRVTSACLSFRVGRRLEIECRKKNKKTNKQTKEDHLLGRESLLLHLQRLRSTRVAAVRLRRRVRDRPDDVAHRLANSIESSTKKNKNQTKENTIDFNSAKGESTQASRKVNGKRLV